MGRELALHKTQLGSVLTIPYGTLTTSKNNPLVQSKE